MAGEGDLTGKVGFTSSGKALVSGFKLSAMGQSTNPSERARHLQTEHSHCCRALDNHCRLVDIHIAPARYRVGRRLAVPDIEDEAVRYR